MVQKTSLIWMDGKLIPWESATVHVLTHTLHYGMGAFEGIRCYKGTDGTSAVFRLKEHVDRLFASALIGGFKIPFSHEEITRAILETLRANQMDEGYIRPLVFIGAGAMGVLFTKENPIHVCIAVWSWGAYLGDEGLKNGIRVKTSSYNRHHVNVMMTKAKICGNYVNSVLAKKEAVESGYDEALMLDTEGYVAEASGENIFIVRDRSIKTTPLTSILPGITRATVIELARDQGIPVVEQRFTRDELYTADEAFFTGTAAEITPIREADNRTVGAGRPGPITLGLQQKFFGVVRGENPQYKHWLAPLRVREP
jgi:branched-chain amino acid aminotransferase